MIVLNLSCENEHLFEGWFASADAFESQQQRGLVTCPICGSDHIERRPNAPYVNTHTHASDSQQREARKFPSASADRSAPGKSPSPATMTALMTMLRQIGKDSEDVGEEFVAEARRIHQGESEARNIKGQASSQDIDELLDEGIVVLPLPPDESDLH